MNKPKNALFPGMLVLVFSLAWMSSFGAAADPVRILPFGDSITSSFGGHSSFRYPLWLMLAKKTSNIDFVGTQYGVAEGEPSHTDFDQDHEGHPGWTSEDGLESAASVAGATQPDIVLLEFGANDVEAGTDPVQTVENIRQIIATFRAANPNVDVIVGQPTPTHNNHRLLTRLNSLLARMVRTENRPGSRVVAVNLSAGFIPRRDTFDGIHPNDSGEKKLAQRWYSAIVPLLNRH